MFIKGYGVCWGWLYVQPSQRQRALKKMSHEGGVTAYLGLFNILFSSLYQPITACSFSCTFRVANRLLSAHLTQPSSSLFSHERNLYDLLLIHNPISISPSISLPSSAHWPEWQAATRIIQWTITRQLLHWNIQVYYNCTAMVFWGLRHLLLIYTQKQPCMQKSTQTNFGGTLWD